MNTTTSLYGPRRTKPSDTPSSSPSHSHHRRHPLLQRSLSSPSPNTTCGGGSTPAEFCGGTTASCAAVWCCCPCGIVNLFVLAVYKLPRGICRRALRGHRRKRLVKNGILPPLPPSDGKGERMQRVFLNSEFAIFPLESNDVSEEDEEDGSFDPKYLRVAAEMTTEEEIDEDDEAVLALEKEMWNRFYGAGFWRSPSQRESVSSPRVSKSLSSSPRPSFTEVFRNTTTRGGGGGAVWQ